MKANRRVRAASLLAVAALGLSACGTVEDLTGGSDEETSSQEEQDQNDDTNDDSDTNDSDESDSNDDTNDDESDDNSSDDESDDTDTDETDDTNDDSDDTESDDSDDDSGSQSLTAPGTELKVGDTATIPQGDEGGTVTVTVSKITEGSFADLSHLEDADEYKDYTPVYVEYTIKGTDLSLIHI